MAATLPTLPLTTYEPTYPAPASWDGCDDTPANATALQTSLNKCTDGTKNYRVTLTAGTTYSGTFTMPSTRTPGTGWVLIRSSGVASLPAANYRIKQSKTDTTYEPYMATISKNATGTGLDIPDGSGGTPMHRVWFHGIIFTSNPSYPLYHALALGNGYATSRSNVPNRFVLDHCIVRGIGTPGGGLIRGVYAACDYLNIRDSFLYNCCYLLANDTQTLLVVNSIGPMTFRNTFFGDACENIMFGGGDEKVTGSVPSDITFMFCCFKWEAALQALVHSNSKNLFESKNIQRLLMRGCIFDTHWNGDQSGQWYAIALKPVNQDGGATWSLCQDITIRDSIIRHVSGGVGILSKQGGTVIAHAQRIRFYNVLMQDVNKVWGAQVNSTAFGIYTDLGEGGQDISFEHITCDNPYQTTHWFETGPWPIPTSDKWTNFDLRNSIIYKGVGGVATGWIANGIGYEGDTVFDTCYITPTINKNICIGSSAADWDGYGTNWTPASDTGLFVDRANGNFRLASPASYVGDDTLTVGADIDTIEDWTLHTEDGQNPQEPGLAPVGTIVLTVS